MLMSTTTPPLLTKDFHFDLPPHLIAQHPLEQRTDSRLLVYHRQIRSMQHTQVNQLLSFLRPGDLLIFNNTKVMQARLFVTKQQTGGNVELLVERCLSQFEFLAHMRASKAPKLGQRLQLASGSLISVEGKENMLYRCVSEMPILEILSTQGHMPLPPYIQRADDVNDLARYQTVYAHFLGSVAAPTAGLHFDDALLAQLTARGMNIGFVTLHIGAGTFKPVRTAVIQEHVMHQEWFNVSEAVCHQVQETRQHGGRVIAVGTTALRALESASQSGQLKPFSGETALFIYPGYTFQTVQGLITNFHLPESTLLILVAAFIGYENAMALYQEAVLKSYRFFSYGDASLLL